eukprot:681403-Rhodomonas_salina.2
MELSPPSTHEVRCSVREREQGACSLLKVEGISVASVVPLCPAVADRPPLPPSRFVAPSSVEQEPQIPAAASRTRETLFMALREPP